jgi:GNAT superfamily N-acetyltransferase
MTCDGDDMACERGVSSWQRCFTPFAEHEPGLVLSLLSRSYAPYLALDPQAARTWPADWATYDREVFQHPDTVGACGFVTCIDGEPIGFASWDPRGRPIGVIGHNCVLPAFQGRGCGTAQIRRVLDILRARGFLAARVTTGDHPFFVPAQRMYAACGFRETARGQRDPRVTLRMIDCQLSLREATALVSDDTDA